MNKDQVRELLKRLASSKGNETIPCEDVIDLAQTVLFIFNNLDGRGMLDNIPWGEK